MTGPTSATLFCCAVVILIPTVFAEASDATMGIEKGVDFAPSVLIDLPANSANYDGEKSLQNYRTVAVAPKTNMFYLSTADMSKYDHYDNRLWGLWSFKASSISHGTFVQMVAFYEQKWLSSPVVYEDFPDSSVNTVCVLNHRRGTLLCRADTSDRTVEADEKFAYDLPEPLYSPYSSQQGLIQIDRYPFIAIYTPPFSSLISAINVYTGEISSVDLTPEGHNATDSEWRTNTPQYSDGCDIFIAKVANDTHMMHCGMVLRDYTGLPHTKVRLEKLWCHKEPNDSPLRRYKMTAWVSSSHYSDKNACQISLESESSITVYHGATGVPVWKRKTDSMYDAVGFSQSGGLVHVRVKTKRFDEVRVEYYLPCFESGYMGCDGMRPEWSTVLSKPYVFEKGPEYMIKNSDYGPLPWMGKSIPEYVSLMMYWPVELRTYKPFDASPILYMLKLKDGRISSRLSARALFGENVWHIGLPTEKEGISCFRVLHGTDSAKDSTLSPKISCLGTRCAKGYGIMYTAGADSDGCVICPPGTYRDDEGVGTCMQCQPNSVSKKPSSTSCTLCGTGEFSEDGISCKTCPEGLTTRENRPGCPVCEANWCASGLCSVIEGDEGNHPVCTCDSFVYGDRCELNYRVHLYGGIVLLIVLIFATCMGILSLLCCMIRNQSKRSLDQYAQLTNYVDENLAESKAVLLEFDKNRDRMEWELDFTKVHIKKRIGSGATAMVYLAVYEGMEVAVKEIIDTMSLGLMKESSMEGSCLSEGSVSLKREVEVLKALRHPHLVHCWGMIAQPPCLVTEYADGGTLSDIIHGSGHVSESRRQELALHVARGMAFLHSQDLIHRDLKPENVLIVRGVAKVADFGITRKESGMMTSLAGTMRYMAPEVMQKEEKSEDRYQARYNNKADVYSYGILLWEIYHRKYPFYEYEWESQVAAAVVKGVRPTFSVSSPLSLRGLVEECWREQPWERPSFNEIVERLNELWSDIDSSNGRQA